MINLDNSQTVYLAEKKKNFNCSDFALGEYKEGLSCGHGKCAMYSNDNICGYKCRLIQIERLFAETKGMKDIKK